MSLKVISFLDYEFGFHDPYIRNIVLSFLPPVPSSFHWADSNYKKDDIPMEVNFLPPNLKSKI